MKNLRITAVFSKRRKAILGGGLVLAVIVALWFFVFSPRYPVEIFDNRFQLRAFEISRCEQGSKHTSTLYDGNPLMGKLLDSLRRIGIRIGSGRSGRLLCSSVAPSDGWFFTVGYTMENFKGDTNARLSLVDETGKEIPLQLLGMSATTRIDSNGNTKNTNLSPCAVELSAINPNANYYLRFTLPEQDLEVARIHLGKLQKWK